MSVQNKYREPMEPFPTLTAYASNTELETCGLRIFYFEAGSKSKPTILMIHGLGDEADTWRHIIQPLAEKYHVVALDLPGFGRSEKPAVKYTPGFFKDAIIGLLDQLSIEKPILMGSSLGGILAHDLAITSPERIAGLVLVDGGLLQREPMGDRGFRIMMLPLVGEWFYTHLRNNADAAYNSLGNVYANLDGLPDVDREFLYTRVNKRVWSDGQRRAYFSTLRNLMRWVKNRQSLLTDQLQQLQTPTLIIRGEFDPLFSEANALGMVKMQPEAQFITIEGSGHLPHQEHPQNFLEAVIPWLNKIS
jgi:pimeloyl-ACP methyl ester carboxylesterase